MALRDLSVSSSTCTDAFSTTALLSATLSQFVAIEIARSEQCTAWGRCSTRHVHPWLDDFSLPTTGTMSERLPPGLCPPGLCRDDVLSSRERPASPIRVPVDFVFHAAHSPAMAESIPPAQPATIELQSIASIPAARSKFAALDDLIVPGDQEIHSQFQSQKVEVVDGAAGRISMCDHGSTDDLPALGSALHVSGSCKPCGWFWKPQGCANGSACRHCHTCPDGELKQRRRAKNMAMRGGVSVELAPRKATVAFAAADEQVFFVDDSRARPRRQAAALRFGKSLSEPARKLSSQTAVCVSSFA